MVELSRENRVFTMDHLEAKDSARVPKLNVEGSIPFARSNTCHENEERFLQEFLQ